MIRVYAWSEARGECARGGLDALPDRNALPDVLWVDLEDPTPEEERRVLEEFFPTPPLPREDVPRLRRAPGQLPHFPKVEEFKDYLFVVVNPLRPTTPQALAHLGEGGKDEVLVTQL